MLFTGDCREVMPSFGPFDLILADPPYGITSLQWDRLVHGWERVAHDLLKPSGSLWVFGSMRSFMTTGAGFSAAGLRYAQEVIWEKHNGSSFHADRFRRVHEIMVQFYRSDSLWRGVFNQVQTTPDATRRTVLRAKRRPPHMGSIASIPYHSTDGGPRLMRSVIQMRSAHHGAIHPTEKPSALLEILIKTSCPPGGLVADFFAGSGAAAVACLATGRQYVGTECDLAMADRARTRLLRL